MPAEGLQEAKAIELLLSFTLVGLQASFSHRLGTARASRSRGHQSKHMHTVMRQVAGRGRALSGA